jgi:hypothetical protein
MSRRDKRNLAMIASVPLGLGVGRAMLGSPSVVSRAYHIGMRLFAYEMALAPLLPALGPKHKVGIRYGWTGEWVRWDQHPIMMWYSMPSTRGLPIPEMGWGPTSVPVGSSRLVHMSDIEKSRGGSTRPKSSQQVRRTGGPSAQGASGFGRSPSARKRTIRRAKASRRGVSSAPWCFTHKRRHWCRYTRK